MDSYINVNGGGLMDLKEQREVLLDKMKELGVLAYGSGRGGGGTTIKDWLLEGRLPLPSVSPCNSTTCW